MGFKRKQTDYLILGAGILGSAVAYELSRRGIKNIDIVDADLEGEFSSTERNAGGVRHLWQNKVNVDLSKTSIDLFRKIGSEIGFQSCGYLWLFSKAEADAGENLLAHTKTMGLTYKKWDLSTLKDKYPFLDKRDDLAFALFGPQDGLLNSNSLKNYFRGEAVKKGAVFSDSICVIDLEKTHDGTEVNLARFATQEQAQSYLKDPSNSQVSEFQIWEAKNVVLCLGAWVHTLPMFKNSPVKTDPVRRQISVFKAEGFDMTPYGMVVDSSRVYFHPEGGNILAGYVVKEEKPGFNFEYDSDFFESQIWPNLYERSSHLERLKHVTGWSGLYHYTPDTSGILGAVSAQNNVFEAHSFTGRGVMQSYGAAVAIADLMLDGKFTHLDASSLSRDRFLDPSKFLPESLHI